MCSASRSPRSQSSSGTSTTIPWIRRMSSSSAGEQRAGRHHCSSWKFRSASARLRRSAASSSTRSPRPGQRPLRLPRRGGAGPAVRAPQLPALDVDPAADHARGRGAARRRPRRNEAAHRPRERGLFTNRLDDVRFRYHNLFREFLERRLVAERRRPRWSGCTSTRRPTSRRPEQWPEAIHLRAGLQRQAARLIAKHGEEVVAEGRLGLVDEWLQQLPDDTIKQTPASRSSRRGVRHPRRLGARAGGTGPRPCVLRAEGRPPARGTRLPEAQLRLLELRRSQ